MKVIHAQQLSPTGSVKIGRIVVKHIIMKWKWYIFWRPRLLNILRIYNHKSCQITTTLQPITIWCLLFACDEHRIVHKNIQDNKHCGEPRLFYEVPIYEINGGRLKYTCILGYMDLLIFVNVIWINGQILPQSKHLDSIKITLKLHRKSRGFLLWN